MSQQQQDLPLELTGTQIQQNLIYAAQQQEQENEEKRKFNQLTLRDTEDKGAVNYAIPLEEENEISISIGQGGRAYQQDRADAQMVNELSKLDDSDIQKILYDTVVEFGDQFSKIESYGATGTVVIFTGNALITANLGDSRAVLLGKKATQLSYDHKPFFPPELKRLKRDGGELEDGKYVKAEKKYAKKIEEKTGRPARGIAIARSFGNDTLYPGKSHIPSISMLDITNRLAANEDLGLVLASDGLWDAVSSDDLLTLRKQYDDLKDFTNEARNLSYQRMCAFTENARKNPFQFRKGNEFADNCVVMASQLIENCVYAVFDGHGMENDIVDELREKFIPKFRERVRAYLKKNGIELEESDKNSTSEPNLSSQDTQLVDSQPYDSQPDDWEEQDDEQDQQLQDHARPQDEPQPNNPNRPAPFLGAQPQIIFPQPVDPTKKRKTTDPNDDDEQRKEGESKRLKIPSPNSSSNSNDD